MKKYLIVISLLAFFWPMALQAETNTVTSTVTGTTTVDKTPPTASAPNVMINNQDVCSTGTSAAVQTQVLGIAGGTTIRDLNCERLKLSRALYGMGMKVAAVSTLCADYRIFDAMWMSATYCPFMGAIGEDAKSGWEANRHLVPAGSKVFISIEQAELKQEKAAQEIFKIEQEEQKRLEEDKQALLRELDAGINDDNKISAAAILSSLAFLLLL
mgnify:CR=1 FL=1